MDKYRLRCITDDINEYIIASVIPTTCPTNAGHTIDSDSIVVVKPDIQVNDGTPKDLTLADYKQLCYNEIDLKTVVLISSGFTYDSHQFSASIEAQTNWNTLKDNEIEFTWPVDISCSDNNTYSLSQANLDAFWTAGKDVVKANLDSGRALKQSVYDAADEAAVDEVVDSR